ncbi:MAG: HNH endonuclease [Nitrococcus sp.]|nr:HNH endonuclease [Nitrococcus sp.]
MTDLGVQVQKALIDAGYDLLDEAGGGWTRAHVSGGVAGEVWLRSAGAATLLAVPERDAAERIGLPADSTPAPAGARSLGRADTAEALHRALALLRTMQSHPSSRLTAELEARLERMPATERTREVRQRIGQDVFREALMDFWGGRCALSGMVLPPALLRASHAKPWQDSDDQERLDPFNGLLLAVRYDALFDKGLIAFDDAGALLVAAALGSDIREFVGLREAMRLRFVVPGHRLYLRYHRQKLATWSEP